MLISSSIDKNQALSLEWHLKHTKSYIPEGAHQVKKMDIAAHVLSSEKFKSNHYFIEVSPSFWDEACGIFADLTNVTVSTL
jgi:hypothetical protein